MAENEKRTWTARNPFGEIARRLSGPPQFEDGVDGQITYAAPSPLAGTGPDPEDVPRDRITRRRADPGELPRGSGRAW